jgi:hypothetical protein
MVSLRDGDFQGVFVPDSLDSKLLYSAKLLALTVWELPMPWVTPTPGILPMLAAPNFSVIRKSIGQV